MSRFKHKNRATVQPQQSDVQFRSPLVRVGEPLMTRLLLVGGCEKDERKLAPKLKDYNSSIGWHWMNSNALATRGVFPSCDGVLVFTRACSHSLTKGVSDLARKAGVPVIPFDSWPRLEPALKNAGLAPAGLAPRTEMVTISVSTAAALAVPIKEIHVAPPVPQAAPAAAHAPHPVTTTGRLKVYPQDDEILLAVHTDWDSLPAKSKTAVQDFIAAYSVNRGAMLSIPSHVGTALYKYAGNARGFVAFVALATKDANVTAATLGFLYTAISGKNLHYGTTLKMVAKVQDFCGAGYGLSRGRPGASGVPTPVAPVVPVVATPPVVTTPPVVQKGIRPTTSSDDDVLLAAHGYWESLTEAQRASVTHYLTEVDANRAPEKPPEEARAVLGHFDGQPRAFIFLCLFATGGHNVRHGALQKAHVAVCGKKFCMEYVWESKVRDLCGPSYGLRRGGDPVPKEAVVEPTAPTPVVEPNAPTPVEVPVTPTPAKIELVKPSPPPVLQDVTRLRFERYVWNALDAGEKVTISREGDAYVVSHDDGTDMVFRPRVA